MVDKEHIRLKCWEKGGFMKSDLRVIRTKHNIKEAFLSLLEKKGFEAITIKDITDRGMMNRGTFYAHYLDKYDLMDQLKNSLLEEMTTIIDNNIEEVFNDVNHQQLDNDPYDVSVKMIEYINQEHQLFNILLVKQGDYQFQKDLKSIIMKVIEKNFIHLNRNDNFDYIASYITSANLGVIQRWLELDRKESPIEIAQTIAMITLYGPIRTLEILNDK